MRNAKHITRGYVALVIYLRYQVDYARAHKNNCIFAIHNRVVRVFNFPTRDFNCTCVQGEDVAKTSPDETTSDVCR